MATSVDTQLQADFAMRHAIDLTSALDRLRCCAEYTQCVDEKEEFPQEDLEKHGEEVLESASNLVQEIEKLRVLISAGHKGPTLRVHTQDPQNN